MCLTRNKNLHSHFQGLEIGSNYEPHHICSCNYFQEIIDKKNDHKSQSFKGHIYDHEYLCQK